MAMTDNLAKCYEDLFTRGFSGAEEAKLQKYTNTKKYIYTNTEGWSELRWRKLEGEWREVRWGQTSLSSGTGSMTGFQKEKNVQNCKIALLHIYREGKRSFPCSAT